MKFLITGGAGFIGSAVIRYLLHHTTHSVVNLDALTYAGNLASIPASSRYPERYTFEKTDIRHLNDVQLVFEKHKPDVVMHLAAESHVDRAIDDPSVFIQTNIVGTFNLLHVARQYYQKLSDEQKADFRFHHVSTDEVYGDLDDPYELFSEQSPYLSNNPYSASKASSDHLVRAWGRTYGLPIIITNCSNNYGYYQFPEKLIPHMILNAISGKPLPVYGDGKQIRDWLFVEEHAQALVLVATQGKLGETYNIGGHNQRSNIQVVTKICHILEEMAPNKPKGVERYRDLICYVEDRAGHDVRYAIDASKIKQDLGWQPKVTFEDGLRKTVQWYLENKAWWQDMIR